MSTSWCAGNVYLEVTVPKSVFRHHFVVIVDGAVVEEIESGHGCSLCIHCHLFSYTSSAAPTSTSAATLFLYRSAVDSGATSLVIVMGSSAVARGGGGGVVMEAKQRTDTV